MSVERQLKDQCRDIMNDLGKMIMAARSAFNRHSQAHAEEIQSLQAAAAASWTALLQKADEAARLSVGEERKNLLRLHSVFSRIHIIAENLTGLLEPLKKKIKDGILFSEKAVSQVNFLFDQQTGLLRTVLDVVLTGNEFLKKFLAEESRKLVQACNDFATEHESRLIEGLCAPHAAPLFLNILERFRNMAQQEAEVAELMGK